MASKKENFNVAEFFSIHFHKSTIMRKFNCDTVESVVVHINPTAIKYK